jgi:phosphoribosyl 1,2-cyclic phosphodiesterase
MSLKYLCIIYLGLVKYKKEKMTLKYSSLASSSSGNAFYVSNTKKEASILVDCGISCKQVLNKLEMLKENPHKLKGIFVTHEHTDHIKGIDVLARKFQIPIFATKGTIKSSFLTSQSDLINSIKNNETLKIGGMEVEAFSKNHDASDPVSFKVINSKKLSIVTDIGKSCNNFLDSVNDADAMILEANHDIQMLQDGPYPYYLKKRILSDKGHLSNWHSGISILEHARSNLKSISLAHLSETNNSPNKALTTFKNLINERKDLNPKISVCPRDFPTQLVRL